jgi:hypothetical protein
VENAVESTAFSGPKLCLAGGFVLVEEPAREEGGPPTMPAGRNPVLPVTVFTDYI